MGGVAAKRMGRVHEFVAGKEGGSHCRPERVVSSGDVLVLTVPVGTSRDFGVQ